MFTSEFSFALTNYDFPGCNFVFYEAIASAEKVRQYGISDINKEAIKELWIQPVVFCC